MNEYLTKAFGLTLEIEGLLQLAINRGELTPAEVFAMLQSKSDELRQSIAAMGSCEVPISASASHAISQPATEAPGSEESASKPAVAEISAVGRTEFQDHAKDTEEVVIEHTPSVSDATSAPAETPALTFSFPLNDRYRFRRELFNNNAEEMAEALAVIGSMSSAEEATDFMINDLCFDPENQDVADFITQVSTSFNNR